MEYLTEYLNKKWQIWRRNSRNTKKETWWS